MIKVQENRHPKKKIIKNGLVVVTTGIALAGICAVVSCNPVETIDKGLDAPVTPVDNFDTKEEFEYKSAGDKAEVIAAFEVMDGICKVKVNETYVDVTLDEENATAYQAGVAYGIAINQIYPDYGASLEPYLFENIKGAFPNIEDDYAPVETRMNSLFDSLDQNYQDEVMGIADGMGITKHGIVPDGELSFEELKLAQMIPDCLRPTACSGLALWGDKTVSGDMLGVRCLEWDLGSDKSMCRTHTVLHINNGEKSLTSMTFLGLVDVISGVNDDGVFLAMCDSGTDQEFIYEGRTCYSFALRHCLEEYDNAKDCGEYLVSNSQNFTWSHNVMITDGKEAYCAEDAVGQIQESGKGYSALRDNKTPIMGELKWDSPDSLCIINAFLTIGNYDATSGERVNAVRFAKYNELVKSVDKFDAASLKDGMTRETVETDLYGLARVQNIHRDNLTQMIILDYHQGSVQVAFTGVEGVADKPVFYDVVSIPKITCD